MKGKRGKLFVSHVHWPYLTDTIVLEILANNQNCLCLILQFGSYMSTWVVIILVQMQDSMNVEVIHTCPCHKDGHHIRSLFAVVDVIHEVSKSIDDDKTNSFVLAQGVVYDCNT